MPPPEPGYLAPPAVGPQAYAKGSPDPAGAPPFATRDPSLLRYGWVPGVVHHGLGRMGRSYSLARVGFYQGKQGVEVVTGGGFVHFFMPFDSFAYFNPHHPLTSLFRGIRGVPAEATVLWLDPLVHISPALRRELRGPRAAGSAFSPNGNWIIGPVRLGNRIFTGAVSVDEDGMILVSEHGTRCLPELIWPADFASENPDHPVFDLPEDTDVVPLTSPAGAVADRCGAMEPASAAMDPPEFVDGDAVIDGDNFSGTARWNVVDDRLGVEFYSEGCIPLRFWVSPQRFIADNPDHPLLRTRVPGWMSRFAPYEEPTVPAGAVAPAGARIVPAGVRPSNYGRAKLSLMQSRWNSDIGRYVREYGPRVWPGVPPQALLGYTANAVSPSECTPGSVSDFGIYNVPGKPYSCDNREDPTQGGGFWANNANSARVVGLLGRPAYQGPDWATQIEDQVVMGLIHYHQHADSLNAALPASIRATPGTQWQYALGGMGYVLGNSVAAYIASKADELARVPEARRFGKLVSIASQDPHMTPRNAYPMIRAWQRLETGAALAAATNGNTAWFEVPTDISKAQVEELLACKFVDRNLALSAEGRTPLDCNSAPSGWPVWAYILTALAGAGVIAGVGYGVYRLQRE